MSDITRMVLVDLSEVIPFGQAQVILRLNGEDRDTIDLAAKVLQIGQGDFVRTAVVNAARKIIAENARHANVA